MVLPTFTEESAELIILSAKSAKAAALTAQITDSLARLQESGTAIETAVKISISNSQSGTSMLRLLLLIG
jgi:hypothetical protein